MTSANRLNRYAYVANRPMAAVDSRGLALKVVGRDPDPLIFVSWIWAAARLPLFVDDHGTVTVEGATGTGIAASLVREITDCNTPLVTITLGRNIGAYFDDFYGVGVHTVDMADLGAMDDPAPGNFPDAFIRSDNIVHVLAEQLNAVKTGQGRDQGSHAFALMKEAEFRRSRGVTSQSLTEFQFRGGFLIVPYDNGAETRFPIQGSTFGRPLYGGPQ